MEMCETVHQYEKQGAAIQACSVSGGQYTCCCNGHGESRMFYSIATGPDNMDL
jgi:hypothetical protein